MYIYILYMYRDLLLKYTLKPFKISNSLHNAAAFLLFLEENADVKIKLNASRVYSWLETSINQEFFDKAVAHIFFFVHEFFFFVFIQR